MASDVMASIYIDHEFPTRGMREMRIDEEDISHASPEHFSEKSGHDATIAVPALDQSKPLRRLRPQTPRSSTDPTSTYSSQNILNPSTPVNTHRNRSPYSRSHLRSRSSGTSVASPGMARAHSWAGYPAATTTDLTVCSSDSTLPAIRTPVRTRSPFKPQEDNMVYNTPQKMWYDGLGSSAIESIQEDSELDITPRGQPRSSVGGTTISRSSSLRRRPASPLHGLGVAGASHSSSYPAGGDQNTSFGPITYHSSPSLAPQKFNEAYPSLHHYASSSSFSSISSTPTSQRSRSPSISSLETIEDVPDLEIEAIETERLERFKLAAERAENGEDSEDGVRRRSLDTPRGFGFRTSGTRERKRWSVCGAERRADLDLETIWED